jgi:regulator of protease activity HflC (stomatin/prohibitin superfamily)
VPSARAPTSPLAPAGGLLGGAAALALALLFSGAYFVEPGQAVIIDPPAARAARLAGALGLQGFDAAAGAAEVERTAGYHWTWPAPFAGRHAVALGTQRVRLRAIIRYPGQEPDVGLLVELRFQIVDPERWAQFDRGDGVERLSAELSSELQLFVVGSCRRARQALEQQDPSLASNPVQLLLRTAGFIEANVQDLARAFVARLGSADPVREAGIEVEREAAAGVVRGVSTPLAIPVCGE